MKTKLYYFTGTGNSLHVARDLAAALGNTELIPIAALMKKEVIFISAERVGIVCPVYMWGLPLIIPRFIEKLVLDDNLYIFGIVTYGGFPGGTLKQINMLLHKKGTRLSAGFCVRMPGNYTPMYGAFSEKKQNDLFSKEAQKVKDIAAIIKEGSVRKIKSGFFVANLIFSSFFYKLGSPKIHHMDKDFWVNERCNNCAICVKVCPVNNIQLMEGKPAWQHHCQQCLACLHWCPKEAIEFGKHTPGRRRYRHPKVHVEDIIGQKDM